jgi:hypothetical protein
MKSISDNTVDIPDTRSKRIVRFSVKELLLATTLIAIGIVTICITTQPRPYLGGLSHAALWLFGGGCVGAGLFAPFSKPWIGAVVGVFVQLVLIAGFFLLVYAYGFRD